MKIGGSTALVTGANRGIGKAYVETLINRGAKKVYACMRDINSFQSIMPMPDKTKVEVIPLDITQEEQINDAARIAGDINLLINNAGINRDAHFMDNEDPNAARQEMEVNFFGTLAMIRAFAPILKKNGGGAIVNINSVASFANIPYIESYSATKAALFSLTRGIRAELAEQGTQVFGVYPGPIDTDMSAKFPIEKYSAEATAIGTLQAIEEDRLDIFIDPVARELIESLEKKPLETMKINAYSSPRYSA